MDENTMRGRYIPDNVLRGKRILGLKKRNFYEGIITALIASFIIFQIPFVPKVRWIFIVCLGITIFLVNAIGIRSLTVTELIVNYLQLRPYLKQFHYRRLTNVQKDSDPVIKDGKVLSFRKNGAQKIIRRIIKNK